MFYISTLSTFIPQSAVASSSKFYQKSFILMKINCYVGDNLHGARNTVSVTENLVKILRSQNIS